MTKEEAIARIKEHIVIHRIKERRAIHITEALEMAIEALEQEPCEDAVSRQAVLDTLESIGSLDTEADRGYARSVFEALPSVTPQPKTGQWIHVSERLPEEHVCANRYVEPSDLVLITTTSGDVTVSRYWGNRWDKVTEEAEERGPEYYDWVEARLWTDDVTAWMSLPEPYTGGEVDADD